MQSTIPRSPRNEWIMPDPVRYDEFIDLLQRATGNILAYINAILMNWNDADDVFQESCMVLWEKFDEFQPGTNFLGWALQIAKHKTMDFLKSRSRKTGSWSGDLQALLIADMSQLAAEEKGGDDLIALSDCIKILGDGDQRLVRLCYGNGMPVRQVAANLGRSPQSVHNSLRRIRTALLACIERALHRENAL
jgi:RNA polymerase sigma-70 factor, ECF subfamily